MSVEDRLAILEMIGHYSRTYDGKDADGYAELFTEDAVFEVYSGREKPLLHCGSREAIREWARALHEDMPDGYQSRHHQTGTIFEALGPDSARTTTMLLGTRRYPRRRVASGQRNGHLPRRMAQNRRRLALRPPRGPHGLLSGGCPRRLRGGTARGRWVTVSARPRG